MWNIHDKIQMSCLHLNGKCIFQDAAILEFMEIARISQLHKRFAEISTPIPIKDCITTDILIVGIYWLFIFLYLKIYYNSIHPHVITSTICRFCRYLYSDSWIQPLLERNAFTKDQMVVASITQWLSISAVRPAADPRITRTGELNR